MDPLFSECGSSITLDETGFSSCTYVPVYCNDLLEQLIANSAGQAAAGATDAHPAGPVAPFLLTLPAIATPSTAELSAADTSSLGGAWFVMEVPADYIVGVGPGTPDAEKDQHAWRSDQQFHSLFSSQDNQQQDSRGQHSQQEHLRPNPPSSLPGSQHPACTAHLQEPAAVAAASHKPAHELQLGVLCRQSEAASMGCCSTPRQELSDCGRLSASYQSLDSLALLPLHNPYKQHASTTGGLDACMFVGSF